MTTLMTRPTDLDRAIANLADLATGMPPCDFENGLLTGLVVLTRVRDGSGPLVNLRGLDFAMIRMAGFAPE